VLGLVSAEYSKSFRYLSSSLVEIFAFFWATVISSKFEHCYIFSTYLCHTQFVLHQRSESERKTERERAERESKERERKRVSERERKRGREGERDRQRETYMTNVLDIQMIPTDCVILPAIDNVQPKNMSVI